MYTCTHTNTHTCMHAHVHTHTKTHTHTHTCMHACTHTHKHKHTHAHFMRKYTHFYQFWSKCFRAYSVSHILTYTHMFTCMHLPRPTLSALMSTTYWAKWSVNTLMNCFNILMSAVLHDRSWIWQEWQPATMVEPRCDSAISAQGPVHGGPVF